MRVDSKTLLLNYHIRPSKKEVLLVESVQGDDPVRSLISCFNVHQRDKHQHSDCVRKLTKS
ncbi:CLUMA_CG003886, isoform A [Clunio marinus]|uniref:CLUMA_CG003886, isoform A n=1 Tax=Clunio marinus TaxID=568069 RepID=A0A1J1HS08_9DIPT|nr:CLUMA_CG003886, isoform A [Clunio marinus]